MKSLFFPGLRWCAGAVILMHCCCLLSQVSVSGIVVDPDGAAVPAVDVLLKTLQGAPVDGGSTTADAVGHFRFLHIAAGNYQLTVPSKYGFERYLAPVHVGAGIHDLRIQ